jgi:hypothetical protein
MKALSRSRTPARRFIVTNDRFACMGSTILLAVRVVHSSEEEV